MSKDHVRGNELSLHERLDGYLPPIEDVGVAPGSKSELVLRDNFREKYPGCDYALVNSRVDNYEGLRIVPAVSHLASVPQSSSGPSYGKAFFDGGSGRLVYEGGIPVGANLILFDGMINRYFSSAKAQGLTPQVDRATFAQGIKDLIAASGVKPFTTPDGQFVRSYIRPAGVRGEGGVGVSIKDPILLMTAVHFAMRDYLEPKVYQEGGIAAVFVDGQRISPIRGKLAENYSSAGDVGAEARGLGADEAIFFGPYTFDSETGERDWINVQQGQIAYEKNSRNGTLPDGTAEDILFTVLDKDGEIKELWVQPLDTNILGGRTRRSLMQYSAPAMGIRVVERPVTIEDVRERRVQGLVMVGNAVGVAPFRRIDLYGPKPQRTKIETLDLEVSPGILRFAQTFDAQVKGEMNPFDPNLLTRVNFDERARQKLDRSYSNWL